MGRKIRKIGRKGKKSVGRKVRVLRTHGQIPSDPSVVFEISSGYQGVKQVKEFAEIEKVTMSLKVLEKQRSKGGHLTIEEIQDVLENPDGIYYDGDRESWLYSQYKDRTRRVVIKIEKQSTVHRIATAHVMSNRAFEGQIEGMKLIWKA